MSDPPELLLRRWIREYGPRLLPVARAFAEGPDEAEDLLQETWIVTLKELDRHPPPEAVGAWLHTILLNLGRQRARRRKRRRLLGDRWRSELPTPSDPVNPSELPWHLENRRLWREIADLPELQRRALLLRVVEGLSTAEAARVLDRAEGIVKASLHRALGRLRRELGERVGEGVEEG